MPVPIVEPEPVVLDIEQDALPWLIEPVAQACFVATPPVGELRAAGQGGLEELAEGGRELEAEPALDGDHLGIGQAGAQLHRVEQGVAGRVLLEGVLGAAETVDKFLPATAIYLRLASTAED